MKCYLFPTKTNKTINDVSLKLSDKISSFHIICSFFTVAIFTENFTTINDRLNTRDVLFDSELCSEGTYSEEYNWRAFIILFIAWTRWPFSIYVYMFYLFIYLFQFFNQHQPNGKKIITNWQLHYISWTEYNFVISQ